MKDLKPEPETIGDYIHYRVRDPELFKAGTYRTIDISKPDMIKAVAGKLKDPPEGQAGSMVVQKYLFHTDKWTVTKARAWVKAHGKATEANMDKIVSEVDALYKDAKILGTKENPVTKNFDIVDCKVTQEDGLVVVRGYGNTKNKADRYGDVPVVFPSLRNYVYELREFLKNPVMLLDHTNKVSHIAGSFSEIVEDDIGLRFTAVFSNSDLPEIKHARTVFLEGHGRAFSMAGRWHYEDPENKNNLTYAEIYHISPVGVGADPDALGDATIEAPEPEKNAAAVAKEAAEKEETNEKELKRLLSELASTVKSEGTKDQLKQRIQELKEILKSKNSQEE